jgi:nitrogen regulatory protein PII
MSTLNAFPASKLITCILPDEGQDMALLRELRAEKGIISANTFQCRGFGLQLRSRFKRGRHQVAAHSVRVVTVVVPADRADELFEYIYYKVRIDHPCPGLIYQGDLQAATPYALPEGMAEESET